MWALFRQSRRPHNSAVDASQTLPFLIPTDDNPVHDPNASGRNVNAGPCTDSRERPSKDVLQASVTESPCHGFHSYPPTATWWRQLRWTVGALSSRSEDRERGHKDQEGSCIYFEPSFSRRPRLTRLLTILLVVLLMILSVNLMSYRWENILIFLSGVSYS